LTNEKDILKKLKSVCSEAKSFLSDKENTLKEKEGLIAKLQKTISDAEANGVDTASMKSTLKQFGDDLHKEEMRDEDILKENLYIIEASDALNSLLGNDTETYTSERNRISGLKAKKSQIEELNNQYEDRIKGINGENDEKDKLRLDIISNTDSMKEWDSDFLSFEGKYSVINEKVSNFDSEIAKNQSEVDKLQSEIDELDFEIESGYAAFKGVHKDLVDNRVNFTSVDTKRSELEQINTTYGVSGLELTEIQSESDSMKANLEEIEAKEKEIDTKILELKESKGKLVSKLDKRDADITKLKGEKRVLESTNESKNLDIKSLKGKLGAWKSNYEDFEKLVDNLEDYVGYPQYSNMEGDDTPESQNPLIPLIARIEAITEWVEQQEDLENTPTTTEVETSSLTPYLIGAAAVGALMMLKR
tara:strand:- start:1967 stop:3223 length:1257 start_codon:yes stop_codon:yes gene_type:complete